jgi:hypothetical protein
MLELELDAIEKLLMLYSELYKKPISSQISHIARDIYNNLIPANTMLSDDVNFAVNRLFSVAYPDVDPDRTVPSKEEILQILQNLRKLKLSLER